MRSLTLRFFLAFWLIILLLAGLAAGAGYAYSERMREALENYEMSDTVYAASRALDAGGRDGLVDWLKAEAGRSPMDVLVIDADGAELLGRPVPPKARRIMRRFDHEHRRWAPRRGDRPNFRPARPLNRLRGPDGSVYTLFIQPKQPTLQRWLGAGPAFLVLALALSAGVSWALARAIARPVRTFREATVAIAEGRLDTRVADSVRARRDEIGKLARDLDSMADKLEQAARRQKDLMQNVSHELRSPLARLRVALELARRDTGDRAEFGRIETETERLDALIGQLLAWSRLDAAADGEVEAIDLGALLRDVTDDANYECQSTGLDGVSVTLQTEDQLCVLGNTPALSSAFENVLRNAIRHSPPGRDVTVTAARSGANVEVIVRDLGGGVPDDALETIFEPFYRASDALASGRSGTGLGLAIAARTVQSAGGHIEARNVDGGFEIRMIVPLASSGETGS